MEPTIYKPGAYKSPGVYNGAGGIYKGRGVYNDGYDVTPSGLFVYKTDFSNFDVNLRTDVPEIGENLSFNLNGTQNLIASENGLFATGNGFINAIISYDFTSCTRITRRYNGKINSIPSGTWCGMYGSFFANSYTNRGAGCLFLNSNVDTQFTPILTESFFDGCSYVFAVKSLGQYYEGQDIEITEIWESDGSVKYFWNNELVCTCSGLTMNVNINKHFQFVYLYASGVYASGAQIYHKKLEIEVE